MAGRWSSRRLPCATGLACPWCCMACRWLWNPVPVVEWCGQLAMLACLALWLAVQDPTFKQHFSRIHDMLWPASSAVDATLQIILIFFSNNHVLHLMSCHVQWLPVHACNLFGQCARTGAPKCPVHHAQYKYSPPHSVQSDGVTLYSIGGPHRCQCQQVKLAT